MEAHWKELLAILNYQDGESILDVGGAMDPVPIADQVIDIMNLNRGGKAYTLLDLCCDEFPFDDKSFDICICSQTLEDLASPRLALREMARVCKRGIIEVPHRGPESIKNTYSLHGKKPDWAMDETWCFGTEHHKWLIEVIDNKLIFTVKNYLHLMYNPIPQWKGPGGIRFVWHDTIPHNVMYDIHPESMFANYQDFRERSRCYWE